MVMLWRHQPIILQIKKYTEIQKWYFKWQTLKTCGHFRKSKLLSWFNTTSTIILCGLTKSKFWPDTSPNITLTLHSIYTYVVPEICFSFAVKKKKQTFFCLNSKQFHFNKHGETFFFRPWLRTKYLAKIQSFNFSSFWEQTFFYRRQKFLSNFAE